MSWWNPYGNGPDEDVVAEKLLRNSKERRARGRAANPYIYDEARNMPAIDLDYYSRRDQNMVVITITEYRRGEL